MSRAKLTLWLVSLTSRTEPTLAQMSRLNLPPYSAATADSMSSISSQCCGLNGRPKKNLARLVHLTALELWNCMEIEED
jgi:hypothetical protein